MKRYRGYLLGSLALLLSGIAGGYYWYYADALNIRSQSFAEKRALLAPAIQVFLPQAEGPRPALLYFHGCGGIGESGVPRARAAAERGFVALVVDSHGPRGIDWRRNCAGRVLQGPERAADVLVALDFARRHPAVDPEQLFIIGFSHGGWTVLESLAFDRELPPGLEDSPGAHLQGVRGVVAWYPYCGFAARYASGWERDTPVLMLLAEEDAITDPTPCVEVAQRQAARGSSTAHRLYARVGHGFDIDEDWVPVYDPAIAREALEEQFSFIARWTGP